MTNYEWYGNNAKILDKTKHRIKIDYGCSGRGIVTCYMLSKGIQINFMDMDTPDVMPSQKFNEDIIVISFCKQGRYECEFSNSKIAYMIENNFAINGTKYLPISFSFPLRLYKGISLVINMRELTELEKSLLSSIEIDLKKISRELELDRNWYVRDAFPKIQEVFLDLYEASEKDDEAFMKIKSMELLYWINQSFDRTEQMEAMYFDKEQIKRVKGIRDYLIEHLEEKISFKQLTKEFYINLSTFHAIFNQIYGDTPYSYLKKYKMNLAAQRLLKTNRKIGEIALELGYSNASKFTQAFESVYGTLPKDYRKKYSTNGLK